MDNTHTVDCQRQFSTTADTIWQIVSNFYADWHPFIEHCEQESNQPVRRFTMPGSKQVYREQLIYYSDAQRHFQYEMLEGISGIERYRGGVSVESADDGCLLRWWANISGNMSLVDNVAKGTKKVFEAGFDEIEHTLLPPLLPLKSGQTSSSLPAYSPTKMSGRQEQIIIELETHKLAITQYSSTNNPDWLCLFLHGIGGNRSNWDEQLPAVAEVMPCAALDLRGYGDSSLGSKQTTVEGYCADIRAIVQHFGTKNLVLAGLSYGSWVATHFALHYPDELVGLVLCGGCTGMSEAPDQVRQGFLQARLEPMDAGKTPADFADNVVAIISGPEATEAQQAAMRNSMAAISAATYRDALHCFTHPPGQFDFGQLACPTLLMTGEHDKLAPPEEIGGVARRMVKAEQPENAELPAVRFEILAGAGHMANMEQAEAYNHFTTRFLDHCVSRSNSHEIACTPQSM